MIIKIIDIFGPKLLLLCEMLKELYQIQIYWYTHNISLNCKIMPFYYQYNNFRWDDFGILVKMDFKSLAISFDSINLLSLHKLTSIFFIMFYYYGENVGTNFLYRFDWKF